MEAELSQDFKPTDSSIVPRYAGGPATFMRATRAEIAPPLDIALVGVPLDLGATYRSGARHGPAVGFEIPATGRLSASFTAQVVVAQPGTSCAGWNHPPRVAGNCTDN